MATSLVVDTVVVVGFLAFYGGLSHDLGATTEMLHPRLGIALSLSTYVAAGVAAIVAVATVAMEALRASGVVATAGTVFGVSLLFAALFGLFFRLGTAVYTVLLRVGLDLS
ncbi:hypothetical protein [Halorussus halophilus]|uniref:hypothetical protein n=1 Tax=Halorussus halophilus TaxID=2650975 RepID=UPI001300CB31|nr:hypothetical protein [Halorussus halophilus]